LFPSIDPVGLEAQLLSDHFSGLAALKPVLDRFAFERFVEFTTDLDRRLFDRCLLHVLAHCSPDSPSFNSAQPQYLQKAPCELPRTRDRKSHTLGNYGVDETKDSNRDPPF
jgi:hypothetical protein